MRSHGRTHELLWEEARLPSWRRCELHQGSGSRPCDPLPGSASHASHASPCTCRAHGDVWEGYEQAETHTPHQGSWPSLLLYQTWGIGKLRMCHPFQPLHPTWIRMWHPSRRTGRVRGLGAQAQRFGGTAHGLGDGWRAVKNVGVGGRLTERLLRAPLATMGRRFELETTRTHEAGP